MLEEEGYASVRWQYQLVDTPDGSDISRFDCNDPQPFLIIDDEAGTSTASSPSGVVWEWMDDSGWKSYSSSDCQAISRALAIGGTALVVVGQSR